MANDINGLQQQDDAEYGDEMPEQMMQVSNALAEQRATKKRAADDVKLLANRIALLKLEEKKVSAALLNSVQCFGTDRQMCQIKQAKCFSLMRRYRQNWHNRLRRFKSIHFALCVNNSERALCKSLPLIQLALFESRGMFFWQGKYDVQ